MAAPKGNPIQRAGAVPVAGSKTGLGPMVQRAVGKIGEAFLGTTRLKYQVIRDAQRNAEFDRRLKAQDKSYRGRRKYDETRENRIRDKNLTILRDNPEITQLGGEVPVKAAVRTKRPGGNSAPKPKKVKSWNQNLPEGTPNLEDVASAVASGGQTIDNPNPNTGISHMDAVQLHPMYKKMMKRHLDSGKKPDTFIKDAFTPKTFSPRRSYIGESPNDNFNGGN